MNKATVDIVKRQGQKLRTLKTPSSTSLTQVMPVLVNEQLRPLVRFTELRFLTRGRMRQESGSRFSHLELCVSLHTTQRLKRTLATLFQHFDPASLLYCPLTPRPQTAHLYIPLGIPHTNCDKIKPHVNDFIVVDRGLLFDEGKSCCHHRLH